MVETDYAELLRDAANEYGAASTAKRAANDKRIRAVKAAHANGGMAMREIATHLGVTHTIVARLLKR